MAANRIKIPNNGLQVRMRTRYQESYKNETVIKCKLIIAEILRIILDMVNEYRVTRFLQMFKKSFERGEHHETYGSMNTLQG